MKKVKKKEKGGLSELKRWIEESMTNVIKANDKQFI
jgi:hypothetical protein